MIGRKKRDTGKCSCIQNASSGKAGKYETGTKEAGPYFNVCHNA